MSFLIILTISTVYVSCTEFKKHVPNSAYPYDIDIPKYNVEYWAKQLHLQQCAFVEVGDKYYAIFVETRPRQYDKEDEIHEYFLGLCDDETLNKWSLCSTNLERKRSTDCTFISSNISGTRVHRRLCDITLLANNAPQCDCNYDLSESRLYKVQGFPTCFKAPLPDSLCGDNNVCGLAACTPETINDRIHSVICDRKCNHHQPFCEPPNKKSSHPREIRSFWTDWSNPFCTDSSCISQFDEATCINKETGDGDIDCLGPGTSCCTPDLENCKCHIYEEDGAAKVFRTFAIPPPELIEYMTEEDFINSIPLRHLTKEEFHKFPFNRLARSNIGTGLKNVILKLYESRPIKFGNKHSSSGSRRHRLDEIKKRFLKGLRQLQGRDDTKRKRMISTDINEHEQYQKRTLRNKQKYKGGWKRKVQRRERSKNKIQNPFFGEKRNLFLPIKKITSDNSKEDYTEIVIDIKKDMITADDCFCGYGPEKTTTECCTLPLEENSAYKELLAIAGDSSTEAYNNFGYSQEDHMKKIIIKEINFKDNKRVKPMNKNQKSIRCETVSSTTSTTCASKNKGDKQIATTLLNTPKEDDLDDAIKAEDKLDLEIDRKAEVEDDIPEEKYTTLETAETEIPLDIEEKVTAETTKAEDDDLNILTTTTESIIQKRRRSKVKEINEDLDDRTKYPIHKKYPYGDDEDYDLNIEKPNIKTTCATFKKFSYQHNKRGYEQQVLSDDDDDEDDNKDDIAIEYADGQKTTTTAKSERGEIKSLNAERFSAENFSPSSKGVSLSCEDLYIYIFLIYVI